VTQAPVRSRTTVANASNRRSWFTLAVLLTGMFIALLDATIVNVALPTIRTSLNASESTLSWIISGYALGLGLALIPAGRVGDRIGHKWVFIVGLSLFTFASAMCGLAQNDTEIVVWRVLQGVAGGIYIPAVGSFIQLLFVGRQRGKAFAILGSVIGISSAFGLIIGGLLIQAFGNADGWRWVFFVNLPVGIIAVIAAIIVVPAHEKGLDRKSGLDLFGALILATGLIAILVPLIEGQQVGWPLWTWATLAGGIILILLFGLWEASVTKRGKNPLVPLKLFTHASFTFGTILALVYFAAFTSIFFTLSLLWQSGLGHSALDAGVLTLPFALGTFVASSQSQRVVAKLGRSALLLGSGMVAVSLGTTWALLAFMPSSDLNTWILAGPLLIGGIGNGFFLAPNIQFIIASVDGRDAGAGSGVVNTMQRLGTAIGIAIIGSILFGSLNVTGVPPTAMDVANAFGYSASLAMGMSAILAFVAFGLVFALPRKVAQQGAPSSPQPE
jgi:EmrB/QacA subfamily drug resistance transporter